MDGSEIPGRYLRFLAGAPASELAEVVRNLAIREMEKGLSTGEKQMYTRAKKILASEFMYALDKDEEGAEDYLDGLLEERFAATA